MANTYQSFYIFRISILLAEFLVRWPIDGRTSSRFGKIITIKISIFLNEGFGTIKIAGCGFCIKLLIKKKKVFVFSYLNKKNSLTLAVVYKMPLAISLHSVSASHCDKFVNASHIAVSFMKPPFHLGELLKCAVSVCEAAHL